LLVTLSINNMPVRTRAQTSTLLAAKGLGPTPQPTVPLAWTRFNTIYSAAISEKTLMQMRYRIYGLCIETPCTTFDQLLKLCPVEHTESHMFRFVQAVYCATYFGAVYKYSHPPGDERDLHTVNVIYKFITQYTQSDEFWEEYDAIVAHQPTHHAVLLVSIHTNHINRIISNSTNTDVVPGICRQFFQKAMARSIPIN
jgi:hypothetical protein